MRGGGGETRAFVPPPQPNSSFCGSIQADRMPRPFLRLSWRAACAACCSCFFFFVALGAKVFQEQAPTAAHSSSKESREQGPPQRIPRQQAQNTAALDGQVRETNSLGNPLPIPGVVLTLRNLQSAQTFMA